MRASTTSSPGAAQAGACDAAVHQPRQPIADIQSWLEKYVFPAILQSVARRDLRRSNATIGSFTSLTSKHALSLRLTLRHWLNGSSGMPDRIARMGRGSPPHLPALPQRRARGLRAWRRHVVYQVLLSHGFAQRPADRPPSLRGHRSTSPALEPHRTLPVVRPLRGAGRRSARTADIRIDGRAVGHRRARSALYRRALAGGAIGLGESFMTDGGTRRPSTRRSRACSTLTCAPGSNCRPFMLADAIAEHLPNLPLYARPPAVPVALQEL